MKVAVWDTYVPKPDGTTMNFDIIVPETETNPEIIYGYGNAYLERRAIRNYSLTSSHCSFCHIEKATDAIVDSIKQKGHYILELKNCQ